MKLPEIGYGERFDGGCRPDRQRSISMLRAIDYSWKGELDERFRIVFCLDQGREQILTNPFQFILRKCWPQGDVCHDRQRVAESDYRHVQINRGGVRGAAGREAGAEIVD